MYHGKAVNSGAPCSSPLGVLQVEGSRAPDPLNKGQANVCAAFLEYIS